MTAPRNDGRNALDRARELASLTPYELHERAGEALGVIRRLLAFADAAITPRDADPWAAVEAALDALRSPYRTGP